MKIFRCSSKHINSFLEGRLFSLVSGVMLYYRSKDLGIEIYPADQEIFRTKEAVSFALTKGEVRIISKAFKANPKLYYIFCPT